MDRLLKFIGLATIIIGVGYGILYLKSNSEVFNEALRIFGLISAIALIGYIVARLIWGKNWILKGGAAMLVGSDLISAFKLFLGELPTPSKATTSVLAGHLVYRFTRLGVLGFLLALIPVVLLWQQNQKIDEQTKLFEKQNEKIDNQIQLAESNRRGALILMMSNIMDKVDEELKDRERQDSSRVLSQQLIGRIAAISQSFRPYRFWQDSILIENPLSPERGQLLLALVNSNLSHNTYEKLYQETTFQEAYLEGVNLINANLYGAKLSGANLMGAHLLKANLIGADLREVNFKMATLSGASLVGANLMNAYLDRAYFGTANLMGANLRGTNLVGNDFSRVNLKSAKVSTKNWTNQVSGVSEYEIDTINLQADFLGKYYVLKQKNEPTRKQH